VSASLAIADGLNAEPLMSTTLANKPEKEGNKLIIYQSMNGLTQHKWEKNVGLEGNAMQ
jgi:hypothetical protein